MVHCSVRRVIAALALFAASGCDAHVAWPLTSGDDSDGWIIAAIVATTILYGVGVMRLWRASGWGRGVRARHAAAFIGGELVLAATLLGTLDTWADRSFAAHMAQHEALMLVAAPLLVQGRPLAAWAWALTPGGLDRVRRLMASQALQRPWRWATAALGATMLQLIVLFGWHIPAVFDYALAHPGVHALQHVSLLAAALCFWWAMRSSTPMQRGTAASTAGVAIACLFITMIVTGGFGALLTFAGHPLYRGYVDGATMSALEDQQLGGLLMWIPGGTLFLIMALAQGRSLLDRGDVARTPEAATARTAEAATAAHQ